MKELIQKIKIKLTPNLNEKGLFAIASLEMAEAWSIKGYRVQKSNKINGEFGYLWVTPPSYQGADKRWHTIVYIESREEWAEIERIILKAYYEKLSESTTSYNPSEL